MLTQDERLVGDTLQKVSSVGLILAAVFLIVFNLLSPRPADPTNTRDVLITLAEAKAVSHFSQLMLAFALLGVAIGSLGIYGSISGRGKVWARLGFYGLLVGSTLWIITMGLGAVTANTAAQWVAAPSPDKAAAFNIAATVSAITSGTETMSTIMFWLAFIFLGIGMIQSSIFPQWLGWAPVLLGFAMVVIVGIPKFFVGNYPNDISLFMFGGLALLTTIWMLTVGIWIARKAW